MRGNKYSNRSAANRGAKRSGLQDGQFEVEQVWEEEGKSYWRWVAVTSETKTESATAPVVTEIPTVTPTPVAPAPEVTQVTETKPEPKGSNVKAAKSTVANPVQVVHKLVAEMVAKDPNVRRNDLFDAAIKAGCAYYTARTQVQIALKGDGDVAAQRRLG